MPTNFQLVDVLIENLSNLAFQILISKLGLITSIPQFEKECKKK